MILLAALLVLPAIASAKLTRLPGTGETPRSRFSPPVPRSSRGTCNSPAARRSRCAASRARRPACPAPQILDATQGATSGVQPPVIRIDGPSVSLLAARQYVVSMQSADGGSDVRPEVPISSDTYFTGAIGPNGAVALGNGPTFTASRVGGPLETRTVDLNPGFGSFQSVGFAGRRPVYVSGGRAPRMAVSHWKASGNIFDRSTWTSRRGPAMVYVHLAGGPRGLWLVHERRRGLDDDVVVRRWHHGRFGTRARDPALGRQRDRHGNRPGREGPPRRRVVRQPHRAHPRRRIAERARNARRASPRWAAARASRRRCRSALAATAAGSSSPTRDSSPLAARRPRRRPQAHPALVTGARVCLRMWRS